MSQWATGLGAPEAISYHSLHPSLHKRCQRQSSQLSLYMWQLADLIIYVCCSQTPTAHAIALHAFAQVLTATVIAALADLTTSTAHLTFVG
jgi:hypothetical protein